MTVLLVLLFIIVAITADQIVQKYKLRRGISLARAPDIYFHPHMAPTMCDGGVVIGQTKSIKKPDTWLRICRVVRNKKT
jgi:hypothetical protein